MNKVPTLKDIAAQLEAQDRELAETAQLVDTIPAGITIDESALHAFDECLEPPATRRDVPPCFGIRV